jgi:hypothetical protein
VKLEWENFGASLKKELDAIIHIRTAHDCKRQRIHVVFAGLGVDIDASIN